MKRKFFLYLFFVGVFIGSCPAEIPFFREPQSEQNSQQDHLKENQILYNGKEWHNLYSNVQGDQFLFTKDYLTGSVSINGISCKNIRINYDIYNDELITPTNHGTILKLNKEMVDSFTLDFAFKTYRFVNTQYDSLPGIKGYINILYKGKASLFVKYKKEIQLLAVDDKYDLFYQTDKIYFVSNGIVHQISSKNDLLRALYKDKTPIKDFIKRNKLRLSKKIPESFIPVIRYYDSLSQ
jgi:hypothetical protein